MRLYSKSLYQRQRENQDALGQLGEKVQSSISGVRVVRAFALEAAELERFEQSNQSYLDKALVLAKLRGSMWPVEVCYMPLRACGSGNPRLAW